MGGLWSVARAIVNPNDASSRSHSRRTRISLSNIRTCADQPEREALVAPVGAESGTAWAAAKRKPDRYANPLRIALRDIVSGTLDRPLGAS